MSGCKAASDIKLDPRNAYFGKNHTYCVKAVADVAGSLEDTFFQLPSSTDDYYVWYNAGTGTDPVGVGTGIEVTISLSDSAKTIAQLTVDAINAEPASEFRAYVNDDYFQVIVKELGEFDASAYADGSAPTGFTFETDVVGSYEFLGRTAGPITFDKSLSTLAVTADQTGETKLDDLVTGFEISVSMELLEMNQKRWESVVGSVTGGIVEIAGADNIVGYGSEKIGQSLITLGGTLVLEPLVAGEATVTVWKTAPLPSSINFSGVEQQVMEVTFSAYIDDNKNKKVNIMARGDNTRPELWL